MTLFNGVDPEEVREVLAMYQQSCAEIVRKLDGWLGPLLGDGVIAYFGYPIAHDDDPVRSVRCGLAIQDSIKKIANATGIPFKVRIGVHRGLVVAGELGGGSNVQNMVIGETPNLAARLQSEARPGEVLISDSLWRLVRSNFWGESIGVRVLKGVERPIEIHRVLGYLPVAPRNALAAFFLARDQEIVSIKENWQRVLAGHQLALLVSGEPGIGKSRLIEKLVRELGDDSSSKADSITVLEADCTPYTSDTPFFPLVALMRSRLGLEGLDPLQQLEKLSQRVSELGLASQEALPLLAQFLAIEIDPAQWPILTDLSALRQRQRTMDILQDALSALAAAAPVLLVIEDLHWADPSTLDLLQQWITQERSMRVLILLSARPEFCSPWPIAGHASELKLDCFDGHQAERLIRNVSASKPMPPEVVREIQRRSSGNPLFLEQITRSVIDSNLLVEREKTWELTKPFSADVVPASMEAALMARIDRLGAAKPLLQLASTLGREFSTQLLFAVASLPQATLNEQLQTMLEVGFLVLEGGEAVVYSFKHALLQDAAYQSLLRSTRQQYHTRIADVLAEQFPQLASSRPELMAHHLSGAGRLIEAASQWRIAAEGASKRSAVHEALDHLRRGLSDLDQLPQSEERWQAELSLQAILAPVQMAVFGWASPLVEASCLRTIELGELLGANQYRFTSVWGLWANRFVTGRLGEAIEFAGKLVSIAPDSGEAKELVATGHATSFTHFYRGEYQFALQEAEKGIGLFAFGQEVELASLLQLSPTVCTMTAKGLSLWMLGKQDLGIDVIDQMVDLARSLHHPPSLASGLAFKMFMCFYARDWPRLMAFSQELWGLSISEGFDMWRANAGMHRAKALFELQPNDAHLADLLEWSELFRQTGSGVIGCSTTCMISEALHSEGKSEEALEENRLGQQRAEEGAVKVMLPEVFRVRGNILADLGRSQEADDAYSLAIRSARSQGALSLQMRALSTLLSYRLENGGETGNLLLELREVIEGISCSAGHPDLTRATSLLNLQPI